jgi:Uncharacterized protein conserved in bacteria (DUF2252)
MNVVKATRRFEEWLRQHTAVVERDLRTKHKHMAEAVFPFLRATFYRWIQLWPEVCSDAAKAPRVLAVGDLHIENFGTWRDVEGRLIWGINDFDEAIELPYTQDLMRLATSAILAAEEGHLALKAKEACEAILDGYGKSLAEHGDAFVLEEQHKWLREVATNELRDPVPFWKKMEAWPEVESEVPPSAREALEHLLPAQTLNYRVVRRVAGLGSLGHVRLVAIAECHGGKIAREAKALVPSSAYWASEHQGPTEILYQAIMNHAVRAPDPFVQLRGRWIVRRLSPHCSRIELEALPKNRDECRLLFAMGWETANVHLGSRAALKDVRRHLETLTRRQLESDSQAMANAVRKDWRCWHDSGES